MKKRTKYILLGIGLFLALFFTVGGHLINKYYHQNVRSKPQMYCYQTFYGPPNPVLIMEDIEHKEEYIGYYKTLEQGEKEYINFPLKTMPISSPVYVMGYTEDSLLAEVVSYYDRGARMGGSFTKGWVYAKTLHEVPPPKKQE